MTTIELKTPERVRAESELAPIEDVVREIANGRMVVLVDDEDRENEGDLVMAADCVTPEAVNFMITHGKGLVCLPMTAERAAELDLPAMVVTNQDDFGTAFTVSIDATARHGVTTGISASDRATTMVLAATTGTKLDLNRPGHVFPLVARPGGVVSRTGHTEAAVDLAILAGRAPMGVIVEIVGEDGEMLRLPQLLPWAAEHGLLVSSIERLREHLLQMAVSA